MTMAFNYKGSMFICTKFHINRLTQTYFTAFLYVLSDHPSYNAGLKTLLDEGLSEQEFYGDLVDKFKKLIGRNDFLFTSEKSLHVTDV